MMAGMTRLTVGLLFLSATLFAQAQTPLNRNGQTIVVEPYAPNVVRVTLSMIEREARNAPGYGFVAKPATIGWNHSVASNGADVYVSSRMTVAVAPERKRDPNGKLPDTAKFFSGSVPGANIRFTRPDGSPLAEMDGWQMAELNQKDDTLKNARGIKPEDLPLYTVGASFRVPMMSTTTVWGRTRRAISTIASAR
jgi:alpha-D-xyloside xylohydrolase